MIIPEHINEIFNKIVNNFDINEIIITGGIADYYNFNNLDILVDVTIHDVDIVVNRMDTLHRLELMFNSKLICIDDKEGIIAEKTITSKGKLNSVQYYLWVDEETHFDIFLIENLKQYKKINTNIYKCGDVEFSCTDSLDRYLQLKQTFEYRHLGLAPLDKSIFKYLRKLMNYKSILGGQ